MNNFGSGLGLLEYLTFLEDTEMEPIMAVYSGAFLPASSVTIVALN